VESPKLTKAQKKELHDMIVEGISLYTTFFLFRINNLQARTFHTLFLLTLYKATT